MKALYTCTLSILLLASCGIPTYEVTPEQRKADLQWIFSKFKTNYGPLEWKEKNLGLDFELIQKECLEENNKINSNAEFTALVRKCVSKFQDAHTQAMQQGQVLPHKVKVAYLGFSVARRVATEMKTEKDPDDETKTKTVLLDRPALKVVGFLPTTSKEDFPLVAGDLIVKVNDLPVDEYAKKELVPYQNLGNTEANLTRAFLNFSMRTTLNYSLPKEENIKLTLLKNNKEQDVVLPWVKKDFFEFNSEQKTATLEKKPKTESSPKGEMALISGYAEFQKMLAFNFDLLDRIKKLMSPTKDKKDEDTNNVFNDIAAAPLKYLLETSFRVQWFDPYLMAANDYINSSTDNVEVFIENREFGTQFHVIPSKLFKAARIFKDAKIFGYIRIDTFNMSDDHIKEFYKLVKYLNRERIDGVIIDTLDNGGGSLVHGMRVLDTLSPRFVEMPKLQLMTNDNWFDSFRSIEFMGKTDVQKTWASRIALKLYTAKKTGQRLTESISARELDPLYLSASKVDCESENSKRPCFKEGTKFVLLVNELCASMCDIFAAAFRDNKFGKIIGIQTMGAGGNVTSHASSPASHFVLNQTESLVVDNQGEYLENQGVKPDEKFDTIKDRENKFNLTFEKVYTLF